MQVQVTGHHVEISGALKSYIQEKLARLEDHYPKMRQVSVIVTVEKYRHTAEIHFHADGTELSAKKTTKDMYASIEEAVAALVMQTAKRKDRLRTSSALRRTAAKAGRRGRVAAAEAPESEPRPKVVRVRNPLAKPVRVEEAVDLLEASGKAFVLFREEESGDAMLLFRRDDGTLGLTEA